MNQSLERKLAAIMFTDIAEYTAQMSKDEILKLIKKNEREEDYLNYFLYQLLENKSYLKTAYNQVQETADNFEDAAKFLSYPIPKAIVEEWEKVK